MVDTADIFSYGSSKVQTSITANPPVSFYFMVSFLQGGFLPNPLDIRFQKVSGISAEIKTEEIREGGENLFVQKLPQQVTYSNLVLERGMVIGSPLNVEFNTAMNFMKFNPSNVLVILLNEQSIPLASWIFQRAYPVKWSISNLDANDNNVVIETMELTYVRFQNIRL